MPTLVKPSSSFHFILVSIDFAYSGLSSGGGGKKKGIYLKNKVPEIYGAYVLHFKVLQAAFGY